MRRIYIEPTDADSPKPMSVDGIGIDEIKSAGFIDRPRGFTTQHVLVSFHDGASVELADGRRLVPPGTTVYWEPGMGHFFGHANRSWNHSWLIVRGTAVAALFRAAAIPTRVPLPVRWSETVAPLLDLMFREVETYRPPDSFVLEHCLHLLVHALARSVHGGEVAPVPKKLRDVCRTVEAQIAEPWTLAALARAASLSPSRFSELFRQHFGQPPMGYLKERRLNRAAHLLTNHALDIGQVAAAVGYADPLHFSRRFHRRFGISPSAYRQLRTSAV